MPRNEARLLGFARFQTSGFRTAGSVWLPKPKDSWKLFQTIPERLATGAAAMRAEVVYILKRVISRPAAGSASVARFLQNSPDSNFGQVRRYRTSSPPGPHSSPASRQRLTSVADPACCIPPISTGSGSSRPNSQRFDVGPIFWSRVCRIDRPWIASQVTKDRLEIKEVSHAGVS